MKHALKNKKAIFLDTSIYEKGNFLHGNIIKQLFSLSELGYIDILLPYITYKEIINRVEKNLSEAVAKIKSAKILKNFSGFERLLSPVNEVNLIEDFKVSLDKAIKDSKIILLDYPTINVGPTFEKYFRKEFPFSESKKHEFADAFTIQTLEMWCKENRKQCLIFSEDRDFLNYESVHFIKNKNLKEIIDELLTEVEVSKFENSRLERIQELFENRNDFLKEEIAKVVAEEIVDDPISFIGSEYDPDSAEVTGVLVWLGDFRLVSITSGDIIIESMAEASYNVSAMLNDEDNAFYNSLEDEWEYDPEEAVTVSDSRKLSVQFILYVPASGNLKYMDIILHEVRIGNH